MMSGTLRESVVSRRKDIMRSAQKVALVTGASQGIGAGLVQGFLDRGYSVVACSRTLEPGRTQNLLEICCDVSQPESAASMVDEAVECFGRLDTLVNNAGAFISKPFTAYSGNDFAALVRTNLGGFFHISQRAAAEMLQNGGGHIVNITSSLLAEQPVKAVPAVLTAITKGGLNAATRSLAIEYAEKGIRVNAVAPGAIRTLMHPVEAHALLATMHPLGRMGEVREIVDAVLYLEDAAFVTGEVVHVDGGAHAGCW
jgi:NAD(P)-dependent dehydrogenase (short-subunit alcohol dehydrogenase family)